MRPDTRVEEAWRQLAERGLGQAPVLDKTLRQVGLVSVQDLLTVINVEAETVRDILSRTVADVMTSPVVSTDPITDIRRVARVLLDYKLSGLPVVSEQAELVGILTRRDPARTGQRPTLEPVGMTTDPPQPHADGPTYLWTALLPLAAFLALVWGLNQHALPWNLTRREERQGNQKGILCAMKKTSKGY